MLALYLINWGCNPFLGDSLKKSKQFNQSDITSGIAALTVMLSVNGPLWLIYIDGDGVKYGLWLWWLHCTFHRLGLRSLLPGTGIWVQIRTWVCLRQFKWAIIHNHLLHRDTCTFLASISANTYLWFRTTAGFGRTCLQIARKWFLY